MPEEIVKTPAEQIAPIPPQETSIAVQAVNPAMDSWKLACSMGKAYAQLPDGMVPQSYKGNVAACAVACNMATRMGMDPTFVMQNLYVIRGNPSWSGKSCKAMIDNSGLFAGRTHYRMEGEEGKDTFGCRLVGIDKVTGEKVEGPKVTVAMAKKNGWWDKNGSFWPSMTEMMLKYRAAAYFARAECPEVLMGANIDYEIGAGDSAEDGGLTHA